MTSGGSLSRAAVFRAQLQAHFTHGVLQNLSHRDPHPRPREPSAAVTLREAPPGPCSDFCHSLYQTVLELMFTWLPF